MSSINVGPQYGHRTMSLTYGADNAKEALKWYEPESTNQSNLTRSQRYLSTSSSTNNEQRLNNQAQDILNKSNLVPVSTRSTNLRSEARDAYAYYVPINNLIPPPEPEREIILPSTESPPPKPKPIPRTIGPMEDSGAQTKETSFKPPSPPQPTYAKLSQHKKGPVKPPFFPYGNGNLRPTNDADFMASYSVNPVLHKMTSKEKYILENRGHPVFESALVRLTSYNPDAYSGKGLAARAQLEAEIQTDNEQNPNQSFQSQRSHRLNQSTYTVEPVGTVADADVTIMGMLPDGRREVAIQRNAIMLEDAIMKVGRPLDLGTLLHKQPLYREITALPTVSQPQRPVESYAYRAPRSMSRSRPIQPDGRPVWNKSIVLERQDYQHTLRIDEPYVDPMRIVHDPSTSAVNTSVSHSQSRHQTSTNTTTNNNTTSANNTLHTIDLEKSPARPFSQQQRSKSNKRMVTTGIQTAPQRSGSRGPPQTQTSGIQTNNNENNNYNIQNNNNNISFNELQPSGFASIPSSPDHRFSRSHHFNHPNNVTRSAPATPSFRSRSNSISGGLLSRLIGTPTQNQNNSQILSPIHQRGNSPTPYISTHTHRPSSPEQKEIIEQVHQATHTAEEFGGHAGRVVMVGGVPIAAIEVEPKSKFQQVIQQDNLQANIGHASKTIVNTSSTTMDIQPTNDASQYGYSYTSSRSAIQALERIPTAGLPSNHPSLVKSRAEYEQNHPTRSTSPSKIGGGGNGTTKTSTEDSNNTSNDNDESNDSAGND